MNQIDEEKVLEKQNNDKTNGEIIIKAHDIENKKKSLEKIVLRKL